MAACLLVLPALLGSAGCAQDRLRSGAPGLAPPLDTVRVNAAPAAAAACAMTALKDTDACEDMDYTLGVDIRADGKTASVICYHVTPDSVGMISRAGGGLIPVLFAYAIADDKPADSTNTEAPLFTALLTEAGAQTAEAKLWVAQTMRGDKFYLDTLKAALAQCGSPSPVAPAAEGTIKPGP